MNRGFDLGAGGLTGVVLLPAALLIAGALLVVDGPPILYRGLRVGRHGRTFQMLKFRTMVVGTDRSGGALTALEDPRVTRIGRVLRRTKLDELPQLINVLRGEMSLVGPRPEHPDYVRHYNLEQRRLLEVRPGITGVAALAFSREESMIPAAGADLHYLNVLMPAKLDLELEYLGRRSLLTDLGLIVATVATVLRPAPR